MSNWANEPGDSRWHDATDAKCTNHETAKRHKGIKSNKGRTCGQCYYLQLGGYAA